MLLLLPPVQPSLALDALVEPGALGLVATAAHLAALELQARSVGLFLDDGRRLRLVVSEQLHQEGLDVAAASWARPPIELRQGAAFWCGGARPFLLLPCVVRGAVRGLVCLELADEDVRLWPSHIQSLVDVVGRAVTKLENELVQGPDDPAAPRLDPEAVNLALVLERNEWNVARVARMLGVTRMTIYNRMKRHGVPRKRMPKARTRHGGAPLS